MIRRFIALAILFSLVAPAFAQEKDEPAKQTWKVGATTREGIVIPPRKGEKEAHPLVFAFHGHGGGAGRAMTMFGIHKLWPEAIVVYLQGIPGVVGIRDPKAERTGWQKNPGDLEDRDIKFFDVVLKDIRDKCKVDDKRIYVMGHSNGSRFANVLWATHQDTFAAICSSGGPPGTLLRDTRPISVFFIAGEKDPLVPFEGQMKSLEGIRKLLGTDEAKAKGEGVAKLEEGKDGLELATFLHPGGHEWPGKASELIVKFFQRHAKRSE